MTDSDTGDRDDEGLGQETDNVGAAAPTDRPTGFHPEEPAEGKDDLES